jgi:steroid 5-alpha reductase family enzyme
MGAAISTVGAWAAMVAAVLEAVADAHKSIVKSPGRAKTRPNDFTGPTTGLYRITRHPNYSAEVLYWTSVLISGIPTYGANAVAWIASTLGCYSIVMIMMGSTRRLEESQRKKYGGQPSYEEWVKLVPSPLFPGIHQSDVRGFI